LGRWSIPVTRTTENNDELWFFFVYNVYIVNIFSFLGWVSSSFRKMNRICRYHTMIGLRYTHWHWCIMY
jgi:hypothetical protein